MLVRLIDKYHMRHFFTNDVLLLTSTVQCFYELVKEEIPDLAQFLDKVCVPVDVFAPSWFQTVFVGTELDERITVRIWDMFLLEGQPFLYKVSLALLQMLKEHIMKAKLEVLMKILRLERGYVDGLIDVDVLIENAMKVKTHPSMDPTNTEYHSLTPVN